MSDTRFDLPAGSPPPPPRPALVTALIRRAFRADLDPGPLFPEEQVAFDVDQAHQGSEPLKRALLWRRGALLAALVFLAPATLLHLIRNIVDLADDHTAAELSALALFPTFANIGLCLGLWVAFQRWDRWASSRRILLTTWLIAFITPFLIALFPLRALGDGVGAQQALFGLLGALGVMLELTPKALSLVPGVLRAAMTTKALLPGASAPGWLILLATPFYLVLLFIVMAMPYQMAGGGLMALALFALLAPPIFLVRAGRRLTRPLELDQAIVIIRQTRMLTLAFNTVGALLLLIGLIDVFDTFKMNALDAIAPVVSVFANVFVLGVVGVDAALVALTRAHGARLDEAERTLHDRHLRDLDRLVLASSPPPRPTPPPPAA